MMLVTCYGFLLAGAQFWGLRAVSSLSADHIRHRTPVLFSDDSTLASHLTRKKLFVSAATTISTAFLLTAPALASESGASGDAANYFAPQFVQEYSDFTRTKSGLSYRDVSPGSGDGAQKGQRVVFDWSGYTIGYFGRPFQAKGGPQGGAFDKEVDLARTVLGSGTMVAGLEEALVNMKPGGVRQVIVPYGKLSYPANDPDHRRVGPKPTTFSGQRALNFVLDNPRIDRTLLFNVKVVRIDQPDGKGGFLTRVINRQ